MDFDEQRFNNVLQVILNVYANKKIKLEVVNVDHIRGIVVLRLISKMKCPKCVRTSIAAKLKNRFKHIKKVSIIT